MPLDSPPTVVSNQRATAGTQAIQSARRIVSVDPKIWVLDGDAAPLTVFMNATGKKKSVHNPEYKVIEDETLPVTSRVNGAATASATTVNVDDGPSHSVNSLVRVERTGEVLLVTAISTNALTVTRSWGTTAAAAINDNDSLTILGGAAVEGASAENARSTQATSVTNYCQIFRHGFAVTNTTAASDLYGGKDVPHQRRMGLVYIKKAMEMAYLFGEKAEVTSGATARRSTDGVDARISTNTKDMGGGFNLATFFSFHEDVQRYGSPTKLFFCGRPVASNIALEAADSVRTTRSDKTFGMEITRLESPHGALLIKPHRLMEGDTYKGYGLVVDPAKAGVRYLQTRDLKLNMNIQANDVDGIEDEWIAETGGWFANEACHGRMTNAN